MKTSNLKVGDWIEIRSKEEIFQTLDSKGQLDGMPFMPEMFAFCGQRFRIYKRAHKTCDTVFPVRGRRVKETVHLETRCDGQMHGGCDAGCLLFWKDAWLKPVDGVRAPAKQPLTNITGTTEESVWANTTSNGSGEPTRYVCQATQLPYATTTLNWWNFGQYIEDYTSGNVGFWRIFCGLIYSMYYSITNAGIGVGSAMRWFYDKFHPLWRGTLYPRKTGMIPPGQPTPCGKLNLQVGELVRVKSHAEILKTLNTASRNRGLFWDAEMVPYCGKTYRVAKRVSRIINEQTGTMQEMKSPCIILDSVVCQSRYSYCRMFCPRAIYSYWREIWLERVEPEGHDEPSTRERDCAIPLVRV